MRYEHTEHGVTVQLDIKSCDPPSIWTRVHNLLLRVKGRLRLRLIKALVGSDVCVMNATFKLSEPFSTNGQTALVSGNTFIECGWWQ